MVGLSYSRYFSLKIYILRVPGNFTDPHFDFCRISYDFSKLLKNLPRKYCTTFLNKCKGKAVNNKSTKGRWVNRGESIS